MNVHKNIVVLRGQVASPPQWFDTRQGGRIAGVEVVVDSAGARERVPVSFTDPPAWVADLAPGDPLAVLGRVRKRFARTASGSRPFTDVVVEHAVRAARGRRVDRLVAQAVAHLDGP